MHVDMSDVITMLSSGARTFLRAPPSVVKKGKVMQPIRCALPWEAGVTYVPGARVRWQDEFTEDARCNVYVAVQALPGVSGNAPPTGTSQGMVDGSVIWDWVAPGFLEWDVVVSEQPIRGREKDRLPEGLRSKEVRALWCAYSEHPIRVTSGETSGDQVEIDGELWDIHPAEDWETLGRYTKLFAARRGR